MANIQERSVQREQKNVHKFITNHFRHKSEHLVKESPWGKIDKALTQRYRVKFNESQRDQKERNSLNLNHQSHNSQIPQFHIKRKYLSFKIDPKNNNPQTNSEEKVSKQMFFSPRKSKSNFRIFSSHEYKNSLKKAEGERCLDKMGDIKENKYESSIFSSMIPYSNLSPKYKFIYVKRSKKQLTIDPQLTVSIKVRDMKKNDIKGNGEKTKKLAHLTQFYIPRKNRKNTAGTPTKDLKSFRPWSGFQSEELD